MQRVKFRCNGYEVMYPISDDTQFIFQAENDKLFVHMVFNNLIGFATQIENQNPQELAEDIQRSIINGEHIFFNHDFYMFDMENVK